jgi:hypothetical protein
MAKQIVKGFAMVVLIVGFSIVTAVATKAQSTHRVAADVPFEFIVGNKTLPAGSYVLAAATTSGEGVMIRKRAGNALAIRLTNSIQGKLNKSKPSLVFHRYGQTYFLAEVWNGDLNGRGLLKSDRERQMEREQEAIASKTDATNPGYEVVVVAATLR